MSETKKPRVYAFDFDGVIAEYEGWKGDDVQGQPREAVVRAIRLLKSAGNTIIIHSTRGDEMLKAYCLKHDIPFDYINENPLITGVNQGKPMATAYVDDRAVCYKGQTAEELVEELTHFEPFWK